MPLTPAAEPFCRGASARNRSHNHDHEQHHADAPGERIEHVDDRPERDHRSGEDADQRRHDDDDPLLRALVGGEAPPTESKVFQLKSDLFFSIMYSPVAAVRPFSPLSLFSLTPSR